MIPRRETFPWITGGLIAAFSLIAGLAAGLNPAFALGGSAALAFALIAFSDLTAGVVVYTSIAFFEPGSLSKILIVSALVLAVAWVARVTVDEDRSWDRASFTAQRVVLYALLMLLGLAAVSTAWAETPSEALLDLSRYLLNAIVFVVVGTAIRTRREAAWVLGGYVFAASVVTVVGPVIRPDFLEPEVNPDLIEGGRSIRFLGTVADPNILAALLIPAITLALGAIAASDASPGLRLAAAAAGATCVISLLLTSSRGGLVGLAASLVAIVLFAGRWRPTAVLVVSVLAISSVAYFAGFAPEHARERIVGATEGEGRAEQSRFTLWEVGWRMAWDEPFGGVGVGNYEEASLDYVLEPGLSTRTDAVIDEAQPAHNTYLHILAELGVPGGLLFAVIVTLCVGSSAVAARVFERAGDRSMEVACRALFAGQVGMAAAIFFFSAQSLNKIWLVLALGPAILAVARQQSPAATAG